MTEVVCSLRERGDPTAVDLLRDLDQCSPRERG